VLLVGAGGLGSPAAFYLAAAGVGTLRLADDDLVDRSNLQRQILHTDARIGSAKVASAAATLSALNPRTTIEAVAERITSGNVERLLEGVDVVIDGADNFPARYLLNDACVKLGKPLVYGAVHRFEGQASVFDAGRQRGIAPCYRCLFPEPPPPESAPNCAEAGVLGVLPGVIGLLQATEAIKLILGLGTSLAGRLLHFDALAMRFRETRLQADPDCAVCAPGRPFPGYIDYAAFCAGGTSPANEGDAH
jgi:molybdopterin/thiamine biosynthesis adenylyltransferase